MPVTSTVCTSRYTFLTGRYKLLSFNTFLEEYERHPSSTRLQRWVGIDRMNVGRVLADAGYATGFVGKYQMLIRIIQGRFPIW